MDSHRIQQYGTFADIAQIDTKRLGPLPVITAKELRESGANLAVGAAVGTDGRFKGEVTMVDGKVFMTAFNSTPRPMADDELLGFTQFAHIPPTGSISLDHISAKNPDDLIEQCKQHLPAASHGAFALRVHGTFKTISYRGITNEDGSVGSFESFDAMEAAGSKHTLEHESFQLSGIFQQGSVPHGMSPEGWHFHGINQDQNAGGHITAFEGFEGSVDVMPVREWHIGINSAAQTYEKPSSLLTTSNTYRMGELAPAAKGHEHI